jgi:hypothetical protein
LEESKVLGSWTKANNLDFFHNTFKQVVFLKSKHEHALFLPSPFFSSSLSGLIRLGCFLSLLAHGRGFDAFESQTHGIMTDKSRASVQNFRVNMRERSRT